MTNDHDTDRLELPLMPMPDLQAAWIEVGYGSLGSGMSMGSVFDAMRQIQEGRHLPGGAMVAIKAVHQKRDQKAKDSRWTR